MVLGNSSLLDVLSKRRVSGTQAGIRNRPTTCRRSFKAYELFDRCDEQALPLTTRRGPTKLRPKLIFPDAFAGLRGDQGAEPRIVAHAAQQLSMMWPDVERAVQSGPPNYPVL